VNQIFVSAVAYTFMLVTHLFVIHYQQFSAPLLYAYGYWRLLTKCFKHISTNDKDF
jgi:hypothetical protein